MTQRFFQPLLDRENAGFSPAAVPGLMFWVDANDLTTLYQDSALTTAVAADTDPVGAWIDKVTGTNQAQQTNATKRPLYKTNIQNGLPGLLFDGTDDFLQLVTQFELDGAVTAIVVMNPAENGTIQTPIFMSKTTGNVYAFWMYANCSGDSYICSVYDTGERGTTYAGDPVGANIITLTGIEGGVVNNYRNGVLKAGAVTLGTFGYTSSTSKIGAYGSGGILPFSGHIHEIVVYDRVLSDAQLAQVWDYLSQKWAISSVAKTLGDPLGIPNSQLWVDASRLNAVADAPIHVLPDLSGNQTHGVQATLTLQGLYKTNVQNGLPAVLMDGTDDYFYLNTEITAASELSAFGVFKVVDSEPATARMLWGFTDVSGTEEYVSQMFYSPPNLTPPDGDMFAVGWDATSWDCTIVSSPIGAHIFGMTEKENDYLIAYLDAAAGTPVALGTFNSEYSNTKGVIGANMDGLSRWMVGYICELMVWNRVLTSAERAEVLYYLTNKWGIS
jgi:hypothetical protein